MIILFSSCASRPRYFIKAPSGATWSSILIRDNMPYDNAFNEVVDVIAKRFEMDMISKDGGYGRTNWIYTWNPKGKYYDKYRNRVIFKFSGDRTKVDIKTEAEWSRNGSKWVVGWDSRLLETIKRDVMGAVSRTTL